MGHISIALMVVLAALQAADAYLTWRVISPGGHELNPAMAFLIDTVGLVPGLAVAKLVLLALMVIFLRGYPGVLFLLSGLYSWVVAHNWKQLPRKA